MEKKIIPLKEFLQKDWRHMGLLYNQGEVVICKHKKQDRTRSILFRALYNNDKQFWNNTNANWDFFLQKDTIEDINKLIQEMDEKESKKKPLNVPGEEIGSVNIPARSDAREADTKEPDLLEELDLSEDTPIDPNYGQEYAVIETMTPDQWVDTIKKDKQRLDLVLAKKDAVFDEKAEALVDTTKEAALINKAALLEALKLGDQEAKQFTNSLVESTREMIKSTTKLISEDVFNDELVKTLVNKSNGTVVQHMTRVFLNGVSFLIYYNNKLNEGLANKIRVFFAKQYKAYYQKLLPHIDYDAITLERVFYKGMRFIDEEMFQNFTAGFLVHDIGKAKDIEYHEGEEAYDRSTVVNHVKVGYKAVMQKTNYPREAGLITGYHHEYYGDPSGYGYFRAFLAKYKTANPKITQDYCIAYEMEPIVDYQALAYFPAKVLEIVDVFDALTDPNRKYRSPLSALEAITLMQEEFVEKNLKIDPILLDIFGAFVNEKVN